MEFIKTVLSGPVVLSAIIAGLVSFFTALFTAKYEMKKLRFAANREDQIAEMKAFQEVSKEVTKYIYEKTYDYREQALSSIAVARTIKGGYIGDLLDELCVAVAADDQEKSKAILFNIYANWTVVNDPDSSV